MAVEVEWANSILDIAYEGAVGPDERSELILLLDGYLKEATAAGIDVDTARTSLKNEILDIAPVIEPLPRVLKRVLRNQRVG